VVTGREGALRRRFRKVVRGPGHDTTPDGGFVAILPKSDETVSRHVNVVLGFAGSLREE
jgi:hypothetical protein